MVKMTIPSSVGTADRTRPIQTCPWLAEVVAEKDPTDLVVWVISLRLKVLVLEQRF
jgi:hypothetical protein